MGRILFVDDDTDALETYVKAVSLANHAADVASSAVDGWKMIKKKKYDLIFVDLNLPEVSGFEFIEKLVKDKKTKSIPVVVISALPEDDLIDEVLNVGAQLFLEKPVALADLFSVIEKYHSKSSK